MGRDGQRGTGAPDLSDLTFDGVETTCRDLTVADGITLRVYDWQPLRPMSAPVVFVPGLITVAQSWAPVLRTLVASRGVTYVETREKASATIRRARLTPVDFGLGALSDDLRAVCRELGAQCENAVFVGSSLGANAILEALKNGLECRAAFLIGPNAEFYVPWWGRLVLRCPARVYWAVLPPIIWYLRRFRLDPEHEPEQAERYQRSLAEAHPSRLKLTLRALADYRVDAGLGTVRIPIGVAYAATDALHGEKCIQRLIAALPAARAIPCSSNAMMHSPEIVAELDRFLEGVS